MKLITISQVSKTFNISTRTLRYYEQVGLLKSQKQQDYAYRSYDEVAIKRLQQIIVLRKLRIPLKQIGLIFLSGELSQLVDVFQENIAELDVEIAALDTIRSALLKLTTRLSERIEINKSFDLLDYDEAMKIIEPLTLSKINFKEERSMDELNKASEALDKLRNVRILYLPPTTVASSHYIGNNPEDVSGKNLNDFVRGTGLHHTKPDLRVYGFNNPCPQDEKETYGYEYWVTIPEDMKVPPPLVKKHFEGGLYAVHCIKMGDFSEWQLIYEWAKNNPIYEIDYREPLSMGGNIEEHLNAFSYYENAPENAAFIQLDLLIPIKPKLSEDSLPLSKL